MNSTDLITHTAIGFDNSLYKSLQTASIKERIAHFPQGRLYLEIGGKFIFDPHAQRVLPGISATVKPEIFQSLSVPFSIIFCVNANDIKENRMLSSKDTTYVDYTISMLCELQQTFQNAVIHLAVTLITSENESFATDFADLVKSTVHIQTYKKFAIPGYPHSDSILTDKGYGKDNYIPHEQSLVLVTGAASNSGKMGTCLSQLYLDAQRGIESGYAKFELFPIWNLPLNHPVNLAYEAATVDIGDYNVIDPFHQSAYNISAVNYNRDVDAFPIIQKITSSIVNGNNFMKTYKSPTDMGLNKAGFAITNDAVVRAAAVAEIDRRTEWFTTQVAEGRGKESWLEKLKIIKQKAKLSI